MSDGFWASFFLFAGLVFNGLVSLRNGQKLNDVHSAVDGGWAEMKAKVATAVDALATTTAEGAALRAEIVALKAVIAREDRL